MTLAERIQALRDQGKLVVDPVAGTGELLYPGGPELASLANGKMVATAQVTINNQDKAFHVKLHGIELGISNISDPDASQPNPQEIRYTQEFKIVIHETPGQKPITQCTIPEGLWKVSLKFNVLKGANNTLSSVLTSIRDLTAGPRKIYTALFPEGLCTYIERKEIVQTKGADDWYHTVEVSLVEANAP